MYLYIIQENNSPYGKYGICKETHSNRILNGQSYYSEKIIIHNLYIIESNSDYELYKHFDDIITFIGKYQDKIKLVENKYNIELPKLQELNKYLIKGDGGTELFKIEGLDILNDFIRNEFKLFRLTINELTRDDIDKIEQEIKDKNNNKHQQNENIFNSIFGRVNIKTFEDRQYQILSKDYIYKILIEKYRIYFELATGGGKTYIMFNVLSLFKPDIIIISSPRIEINKQNISKKYLELLQGDYITCNYSDKKINCENKEITFKDFINKPNKKIIVVCSQSFKKLYNEINQKNVNNIFVWFDEAHHTIENWSRELNEDYKKFWLFDNSIKYRVFTSASPRKKILQENERIFGEHYQPIKVKKLIEEKYLCPIIPRIFEVPEENKANIINYIITSFEDTKSNFGFSFHNENKYAEACFELHYRKYINNKTLIKPFLLIQKGGIKNNYDLEYNYKCKNKWENTRFSIAYTCKQYEMGYDFSGLDYISFTDPKTSYEDIKQCIGRGTRPDGLDNGKNKEKKLKILLPIFIKDEIEDNFKNIIYILDYLINDIGYPLLDLIINKREDTDKEQDYTEPDYNGTDEIKSKLLDLLDCRKIVDRNYSTKKIYNICKKNKIYTEEKYNKFRINNSFLKLKKNIFNYKGFKWKDIIDPNNIKYYKTYEECKSAFDKIIDYINQNNSETDSEELIEELEDEGIIKYHEYDNKIPPYNKLKECYY